jgi:stage IV sporulation protein FA
MELSRSKTSVWFYIWSLLIIFGFCWAFLQWNHPLAERARTNLETLFDQKINWFALTDWYHQYIDSAPVVVPTISQKNEGTDQPVNGVSISFVSPCKGDVLLSFSTDRQGAIISTDLEQQVSAPADGRIVYSGMLPGLGMTLVLQHANGYQTWFGMLENTSLKKNDRVNSSQLLGKGTELQGGKKSLVYMLTKTEIDLSNRLN